MAFMAATNTSTPGSSMTSMPMEKRIGSATVVLKGEDRVFSLGASIGGEDVHFVGVADGHGGLAAAEFCSKWALSHVVTEAAGDPSAGSLQKACTRAFHRLNEEVQKSLGTAGTTLTVVAINEVRGELTIAHVGDSDAVLIADLTHTILCKPHRLDDSQSERDRVTSQGLTIAQGMNGQGLPRGPLRAWPGGLAVARSIGDADCPAAWAEPSVSSLTYGTARACALIVASDGVWDSLSPRKVASVVRRSKSPMDAAEHVVSKSGQAKGVKDDTTCIVAWLDNNPFQRRLFKMGRQTSKELSMSDSGEFSPQSLGDFEFSPPEDPQVACTQADISTLLDVTRLRVTQSGDPGRGD